MRQKRLPACASRSAATAGTKSTSPAFDPRCSRRSRPTASTSYSRAFEVFVWDKKDLNDAQTSAIEQPGSVFLVACPGSGKTRTLTYKIARLLSELKSDKRRIVAITYTHRAADEIHERIEQLGVDTSQLWIGTIHSFC